MGRINSFKMLIITQMHIRCKIGCDIRTVLPVVEVILCSFYLHIKVSGLFSSLCQSSRNLISTMMSTQYELRTCLGYGPHFVEFDIVDC